VDAATTSGRTRALVWLSRWRIDVAWIALAALPFVHPTGRSILTYLPVVGAGLLVRLWARGHLDRGRLLITTTGPYALVRHPLYVGSFLMGLGFALMARSPILVLVFAVVFVVMYVPKALREEAFLAERFGAEHARYVARVGALVPKPRHVSRDAIRGFEWRRVVRHREWKTWVGVAVAAALLWLRALVPGLLVAGHFATTLSARAQYWG
jgi:protein-S-isoprenylcysteine O-methyltransferase Ste14